MRSILLAIVAIVALTVVGCAESYDEEAETNVPSLPSRKSVTETDPAEPAPAGKSAPTTTQSTPLPTAKKAFCATTTGHGACFDFDDGKEFAEDIFSPPGKPTGSCAIVETTVFSGTRSLLCSGAAGAFGLKQRATTKLDLKVDAHLFIDGAAKPKTRFAFLDISALKVTTGFITAQADFQVVFDDASPKGRIELATSEQDATAALIQTAVPTKLVAEGWHQYQIHMRVEAGVIAITAKADDVVVFDGTLKKNYADVAQLSGAIGSDAGWNSTNGTAPVFIDDVLVD